MVNYLSSLSTHSLIICLAIIGHMEAKHLAVCDTHKFHTYVHHCISYFNNTMEASGYQNKCPWPTKRGEYIVLIRCLERVATHTRCVEPSLRDGIFVRLHQAYFSLCTRLPQDPALPVLLLLILPCIVTTLLLPCCCLHIANNQ
ncbi:uncharacterized protein LOC143099696 [Alosa pseudoharengus]|uniref:uncharacterized protein LOC143099696 n=1 Tax=Alosa pseudoharengus TaxID=34774 RepID=UPI003F8C6421